MTNKKKLIAGKIHSSRASLQTALVVGAAGTGK